MQRNDDNDTTHDAIWNTYNDGIKEELKEHRVANHGKDNVARAAELFAVFGKEQFLVGPIHAGKRDKKAHVSHDIVHHNVQRNDSSWRKGVEGRDIRLAIKDPSNRSNGKHDDVGSATGIRRKVRCQKDLVVAWNITRQERLEQRCEHSL